MKTLFILLALLLSPAISHADNDLIAVPEGAEEETNKNKKDLYADKGLPNSDNIEDYVRWAKEKMATVHKNEITKYTQAVPLSANSRCLWHKEAFGIKRLSENEYEVNCFAGNAKKISHILFYRISMRHNVQGCADEDKIRTFFGPLSMRNASGALAFANFMNNTCKVAPFPTEPTKPIDRAVKVGTDWVNQELEKDKYEELRKYVNPSKKQKNDKSDDGDFGNPAREDTAKDAG